MEKILFVLALLCVALWSPATVFSNFTITMMTIIQQPRPHSRSTQPSNVTRLMRAISTPIVARLSLIHTCRRAYS